MLETLFFVASEPYHQHSSKPFNLILKEEASMRQHLHNLRILGRQLEESGVLNDSLRSRSNSWGLHMPLVCPDGAVVAYAWKRQLAGQAGASAVDRTRLALKAFTDQKRRFFPHLADDSDVESATKKPRGPLVSPVNLQEELSDQRTVADFLSHLEKEVPHLRTFTYQRLDWLKQSFSLLSAATQSSIESLKDHGFHSTDQLRQGSADLVAADKVAVIELLVPSVFRAIISLHTAGSMEPDAVAFFSPDEGGSYMHARGFSVHHVFRHVTQHASMALQYFVSVKPESALHLLLEWICSYRSLFTKVCSKCGRLLSMDKQAALLLPPVRRPYHNFSRSSSDDIQTFHIACFSDKE
ncbi:Mediator of RNA polymerase II transcription subunit 27 [Abeliophyllum distichum]|uniref:Mediator of RNA polymerase II transcription subunit 27 n=1 Tax=Abeliophyllum distichum TaxID=126358 RepID=A0ABD1U0Q8_9LAMI